MKPPRNNRYVVGAHVLTLVLLLTLLSGQGQSPTLAASQSLGGVTLLGVSPRVVTPNGDALNDVIFFQFDTTLTGLPIESSILDINGAKVSGMTLNSNETALTWNGKGESGRPMPAGIYIYSIKIGKNLATGTVVVAR